MIDLRWSKYPFLFFSKERLKREGIGEADILSSIVVEKARERLLSAIKYGRVGWDELEDPREVFLSYVLSVFLVRCVDDEFLRRRFALAEAKKVSNLLEGEDVSTLIWFSKAVGVDISVGEKEEVFVPFHQYLSYAPRIGSGRWKLVNRQLFRGKVSLSRKEIARFLQEPSYDIVLSQVKGKETPPPELSQLVEEIKEVLAKEAKRPEFSPIGEIREEAFPPCMKDIWEKLKDGKHVPHFGRFSFTAFLLKVGTSIDEVVSFFSKLPDFNERLCRYQVEHIAGMRGSGTKYMCPSCDKMRTNGLCVNPDDLCRVVKNPLQYYRKKLSMLK